MSEPERGESSGRDGREEAAPFSSPAASRATAAVEPPPDHGADEHNNQGIAAARRGRFEEAIGHYRTALRAKPEFPDALNNLGIALSRLGRYDEAAEAYREALRHQPDYPEAHNNLGNVLAQRRKFPDAVASYRQALKLRPTYAKAHNNLANALREVGKLEEAESEHRAALATESRWAEAHNDLGITLSRRGKPADAQASYQTALRLRPDYVEAMNNLGIVLSQQGKHESAEMLYRQALGLRPEYPEAHNNLGNVLARQGKHQEASACYRDALRLRPDYAKAHHNLANTLARLKQYADAEQSYQQALRLRPKDPDVLNDRAIALAEAGRFDEAEQSYRDALRLRPDYAEVHNNLGNTIRQVGRLDESVACYREALRLKPNYAEAHNNLGIALRSLGRLDEAAASYTRALQLRPSYVDAHVNRSMVWLRMARFELGWSEYEWRWRKKEAAPPKFIQPAWNGGPAHGRTVLLYTEQGSGDTFQFIRYAPMVKAQGARVLVQCPSPMIPILSRCPGIDGLVPKGAPPPEFDLHAGLLSVPGLLHTELGTIPAEIPYLFADEALVSDWKHRLADVPGYRVGIVWQGNPKFPSDRTRSIPLREFATLAALPGLSLVSLQVEHGVDQLKECGFPVVDVGDSLVKAPGAFSDAAAVIRNLDLVIACDTAVAHLAGGLGVAVWLALPYSPDWRWLTSRSDTPWYPTMRLFRQTRFGDWPGVFDRMRTELGQLLATRHSTATIGISMGEMLERIAVLEVEIERAAEEPSQRLRAELAHLRGAYEALPAPLRPPAAVGMAVRVLVTQRQHAEAQLQELERAGDFGSAFLESARSMREAAARLAELRREIDHTPPF